MTGDGQKGRTWRACQCSKLVQIDVRAKGSKIVNLSVFGRLGPFRAHLDHLKQTKLIFCSKAPPPNPTCPFGAKKIILSEMVQEGPDGPKN